MKIIGDDMPTGEDLGKVLQSAMKDFAQEKREAYGILQTLVEQGALERYQTAGDLDEIADRLLGTVGGGEREDAD